MMTMGKKEDDDEKNEKTGGLKVALLSFRRGPEHPMKRKEKMEKKRGDSKWRF